MTLSELMRTVVYFAQLKFCKSGEVQSGVVLSCVVRTSCVTFRAIGAGSTSDVSAVLHRSTLKDNKGGGGTAIQTVQAL